MAKRAVVGLVRLAEHADKVIAALDRAGFPVRDLSVLLPDNAGGTGARAAPLAQASRVALESAPLDVVRGGALGLLAGMGVLAIPGVGLFIAGGPIRGLLTATAARSAVGGLKRALTNAGLTAHDAQHYEDALRVGGILILVHSDVTDRRIRASQVLERNGVRDIKLHSEDGDPPEHSTAA